MKADHDKRIQDALDKKLSSPEDLKTSELDVYKIVYESLETPTAEFSLPAEFADEVVIKIEKKKHVQSMFLLVSSIVAVFAVFLTAIFALIHFYPSFGNDLKAIVAFKAPIFYFLIIISFVQIMDWWLVKRKTMQL